MIHPWVPYAAVFGFGAAVSMTGILCSFRKGDFASLTAGTLGWAIMVSAALAFSIDATKELVRVAG